jgi:hypothetical protein
VEQLATKTQLQELIIHLQAWIEYYLILSTYYTSVQPSPRGPIYQRELDSKRAELARLQAQFSTAGDN